ncbi:MAG: serpin family protein [Planctomycetota bacterium]|nr:MAG: serpin family protein [Planctomycetota bacterium]
MKMRIALLAALLAVVFYCGCSRKDKDKIYPPDLFITYDCKYDNPANIDPELIEVADANNEFACDLYGQLKATGGNLFFSPASISTALSMTYAGAVGDTATEMRNTLRFTLPDEELHINTAKLVEILVTDRSKTQLAIANALWGQQGYSFVQAFLDLLAEHYEAPLNEVDFISAAEAARQTINTWVEDQTNGKIVDLLPPGSIDALTRLVLTNAIYFKSDWKEKFDPADTTQDTFNTSSTTSVTADMMHMDLLEDQKKVNFFSDGAVSVLELPYVKDVFSMFIFLPSDADGLPALESSLTYANITSWIDSMSKCKLAEIALPKFEFTSEFNLNSVLSALGMPTAFDEGLADFSGINGGIEQLYISDVVHKAWVKVNEEGTEAAAATGVIIGTTSMPPSFIVDHPFVFIIRHNASGTILFMGRVEDPTQ